MEKVGFLYNSTVCIACGACQLACQGAHGLGSGEYFRRVVLRPVGGGKETAFSGGCNHCAHPACVAACPTGAMYRDEEKGVVLHDDGRCIGCGCCVWNCPYGAVSLSATAGVAQKCDSCVDRRSQGLEPFCVAACPMGALRWRDPPPKEPGWKQLSAPFLPEPGRTDPSTMARFPGEEEEEQDG